EKPFGCPKCLKEFVRKYDLKRHMLTHTGEKSFVCEGCDKLFSRRDVLKSHK
ncbi:hypothetical protein BJ085DRAFT_11726, partial [Dimargaris cristalligena]